jgi:hypothetical protein
MPVSTLKHRDVISTSNHIVQSLEYADAAARLADARSAADVGRLALQLDGPSFWVLTAAPDTWVQIAPNPLASDLADALVEIAGLTSSIAALTASKAGKRLTGNTQTGATYSIVQADEDVGVIGNRATAQTLTADQLAAGTVIPVMQLGAGQITIAAGTGVTLRAPEGAKTGAQYKTIVLWWYSATEVWISGQAAV